MAYRCEVTGKGPRAGKHVSHSHRVTKRRFLPNLQVVKVQTANGPKKMMVSVKALKSGLIKKAA